jgi:outer membrane protein TolC
VPVPNLGPKPVPRSPKTIAAQPSLSTGASTAWPGDGWWHHHGKWQPDGLIDKRLRYYSDVAVAATRFRSTSGMAHEAGGATMPQIDSQGSVVDQKQSIDLGYSDQ